MNLRADPVDRRRLAVAGDRAVGAHMRAPAALGVRQFRAGGDETGLHEAGEGHARLGALAGGHAQHVGLQRLDRQDAVERRLDVVVLAFDADEVAPQPLGDGSRGSRAEERVEDRVTRPRGG